ncbi:MAG: hypothetical protein O8C66_06800 [Candidatus Methanoperedens sp.]|nr:hypothetical protein [Candidatus Methanoperedens sp.]
MSFDFKKCIHDPLYKNSLFILLNSLTAAFFGFLFWMLAARLYSSEDVGLGTALISSAGIIVSLSSFGLGTGIIRFLPKSGKKAMLFNSVWIVSIASAAVFGTIFLKYIEYLSPALAFLMEPGFMFIFLLFLIFQASASLVNTSLLALRKAEYSFTQDMGLGLRILMLIPLTFAGVLGIFESLGIAYLVSFVIGLFLLFRMGIAVRLHFCKKEMEEIFHFSLANYVADFLLIADLSILPILILNVIGAKEAAYFYISFSIASLLYAIPNSIFMSMFIEGSYGEPLRKIVIKSLAVVGALLVPAGLVMYFHGDVLLSLFSREYSQNAYEILKLLVLSCAFVTFNAMFMAIKRIQSDIRPLIAVNALLFVSTVLFSYIFMQRYGIFGVGVGWMAGQGVTAGVAGVMVWRKGWK